MGKLLKKSLGRTMFAPTICVANAITTAKTACTRVIQKATLPIQEKADKGVCKPQADSEENERFRRTGLKSQT